MFYCDPCRKLCGWPESMSRSLGQCEVCEIMSPCFNVPSYRLPSLGSTLRHIRHREAETSKGEGSATWRD